MPNKQSSEYTRKVDILGVQRDVPVDVAAPDVSTADLTSRPKPSAPVAFFVQQAPEQDFSPVAAARRELSRQLEYADTMRELNHKITRTEQGIDANVGPQSQYRYAGVNYYKRLAQNTADTEMARRTGADISKYPSLKTILDQAKMSGANVTTDDVRNLVNFGMMNDAANTIITGMQAGDPNVATNVITTLGQTNPVMATLLPDFIQQKLEEAATDPTVMDKVLGTVGTALSAAIEPFAAANRMMMDRVRAANYRVNQDQASEFVTIPKMVQGFFSSGDIAATAPGQFNQDYLQSLRTATNEDGSPKYDPKAIEIMTELVRLKANGDPEPIKSLWSDKYKGDLQAAKIFGDLIYNRADGNTQELFRQIESADLGDTGWSFLGSGSAAGKPSDLATWRGTTLAANTADVAGAVAMVALDPTNIAFGLGRSFQAARWTLTRLAPGAERASEVLAPITVAGVPVRNPARAYFQAFTRDLNSLDGLYARASEAAANGKRDLATRLRGNAASLRSGMSRQYDAMPEQLIEDFRKNMGRNADGKFDVESAAKWIDDTNDAYLITVGEIAPQLADLGATDALKRASVLEALNMLDDADEAAAIAKRIETLTSDLQKAQDSTFYAQVGRQSIRGDLLIPRMSSLGQLRTAAVNQIRVSQMLPRQVDKLIDSVMPRLDSVSGTAEDLSTNAQTLGDKTRLFRMTNVPDTIGRMFSSLPDVSVLSLTDASSTKAFYRLSRAFLPKRVSQILAEQWRNGDPGSRRKLVIGVVRSSAAVRGVTLTDAEAATLLDGLPRASGSLITGTRPGELYGVTVPGNMLPSEKALAAGQSDILFHGTNRNFDTLSETANPRGRRSQLRPDGKRNIYFTDNPDEAMRFARDSGDAATLPDPEFNQGAYQDMIRKYGSAEAAVEDAMKRFDFYDDVLDQETQTWIYRIVTRDEIVSRWNDGSAPYGYPKGQAPRVIEKSIPGRTLDLSPLKDLSGDSYDKWVANNVPDGLKRALRDSGEFDSVFNAFGGTNWIGHERSAALPNWAWANGYNKIKVPDSVKGGYSYIVNPSALSDVTDAAAPTMSLSADANGIEHALHLSDTADHVRIPNIRQFEDLRATMGMINQLYYKAGVGVGHFTDYYSLLTLAGFRFGLRNAIEEDALYLFQGNNATNLLKGRAADQTMRRANPRLVVRIDKDTGEPTVVRKSNVGMFANKLESASLWMQKHEWPAWLSEFVYSSVSKADAEAAAAAHAAGDPRAFVDLVVKSQVAHKLGAANLSMLSEDNMKIIKYLASSQHGMQLYSQISDAAPYMFSGSLPKFLVDSESIDAAIPGVAWGRQRGSVSLKFGDYKNVPTVEVDPITGRLVQGVTRWWGELQKFDGDGPVGEAAVRMLTNPSAAKAEIASIIRNDTEFGYKQRFSRITDDASIDEFANAYFENVFHNFTKADGTLNLELRNRFMHVDPQSGEMRASFWKPAVDGEQVFSVTQKDLKATKVADRPAYVLGREIAEGPWIPTAADESALLSADRVYEWMGRQNSRLSKGPIFMAHLFNDWEQTTSARTALAETMAKAAGRTVPNEADISLAESLYAKSSMDNAYNMAVSYIDNPANRSNLAWKVRNVSRYYRATEDFWRRMGRVAKTNPEAFWKASLTYQVASDSAFVYSDDQGNQYFGYPGNEQLQRVISWAGSLLNLNVNRYTDVNPFMFGGKITGLAPSTDPKQQFPTAFGAAAITLTAIYDLFPALYKMKGLQQATLGTYAQVSGDLGSDLLKVVVPAGVQKAIRTTNPDAFDASLGQGAIDALAIMAANGMLDNLTNDGQPVPLSSVANADKFQQTDQYKAATKMAMASVITRTILAYTGAAAPQAFTNDVSAEARDLGITGMKPAFRMLLDAHKDDADPFAGALSDFLAMQGKKTIANDGISLQSFIPFTMSSYKSPNSTVDNNLEALAKVQSGVKPLIDWWQDGQTQDLVRHGYRSSALFLSPRTGEFDWASWNLLKNDLGLKVKKSEDEMVQDLLAGNGKRQDTQIVHYYDDQIAALDPSSPNYRQSLRDLNNAKEADRKMNRTLNPAWDLIKGQTNTQYTDANFRQSFNSMRGMLDYMRERDGKLTGSALQIDNAMKIYMYYAPKKDAIQGSAASKTAAKADITNEMNRELAAIATTDPSAAVFIDSVINNMSYDKYLAGSGAP